LRAEAAPGDARRGGRDALPRPGHRPAPRAARPAEPADPAGRLRLAADQRAVLTGAFPLARRPGGRGPRGEVGSMSLSPPDDHRSAVRTRPVSFWKRLKELSMFFQGRDEVHKTMRRLAKRLDKANIPYVIVGGMAVFAHHYRRATDDVDILLTPEGF